MLIAKLLAQDLSTLVIEFLSGRVMAEIRLQVGIGDQACRIRGVVDSRLPAQDGESLFNRVSAWVYLPTCWVSARRLMRSVPDPSPRSAGAVCDSWIARASSNREIARSYSPTRATIFPSVLRLSGTCRSLAPSTWERIATACSARVRASGRLGGVAAEEREIVGAFRIIGRLDFKIRLTEPRACRRWTRRPFDPRRCIRRIPGGPCCGRNCLEPEAAARARPATRIASFKSPLV